MYKYTEISHVHFEPKQRCQALCPICDRTNNPHIKNAELSIEQFKKGDRLDLAEKETQELNIVKSFLPEQMSKLEIKKIVLHIIDELGASHISDMGKVMKASLEKTNGMADGKVISELVREQLK